MLPKFRKALGMSASLHIGVSALAVLHQSGAIVSPQAKADQNSMMFAVGTENTNSAPPSFVAVEVTSDPLGAAKPSLSSSDDRRSGASPAVTESGLAPAAAPTVAPPRLPRPMLRVAAKAGTGPTQLESQHLPHSPQTLPEPEPTASLDATRPIPLGSVELANEQTEPPRAPIDRLALHQAMQVAAAASGTPPSATLPPIFRVDLQEKNLDRAMARAFAWAFAVDRSYFTTAPIGRARFVVELPDGGQIGGVLWLAPPAPDRLKQFVQRIAQLLSANRFRIAREDGAPSNRRAYELVVVESHNPVPTTDARVGGRVGDIWMLEAGETPTPGKPSHPAVADATGHQLRGELRLLEAEPE